MSDDDEVEPPAKRACRLACEKCRNECHKFNAIPPNGSSPCWKFFRVDGVQKKDAFCELCHQVVGWSDSPSPLFRHLGDNHVKELVEMCSPKTAVNQPKISAAFASVNDAATLREQLTKEITESIIIWAADCSISPNALNHKNFRNDVVNRLNRNVVLPDKNKLKVLVDEVASKFLDEVRGH